MKIISICTAALLCTGLFSTQALALEVNDGFVQVNSFGDVFRSNDADTNNYDYEWAINTWSWSGINSWQLYSEYAGGNIIDINIGETTAVNALDSLTVDTNGDIFLANGSVFIDRSENRMGIGTTVPEAEIHIKSGDGNMILEWPDYSSKWILGTLNDGGFAIADYHNLSAIPFRIDPGAPGNLLRITSTGEIQSTWLGSNTVDDGLKNLLILSANNSTGDTSDAGFGLRNDKSGFQWNFRTGQNGEAFIATKDGNGGADFQVLSGASYTDAEVQFGGVTVFKNGQLVDGSGAPLSLTVQKQSILLAEVMAKDVEMKAALKAKDKKIALLEEKQKEQSLKIANLETMQQKVAMMESILTNLALDTSKTTKDKVTLNSK